MRITTADLLDALAEASKGSAPEDARTVQQMADEHGIPNSTVARALRTLAAQGRVMSHRVPHVGIDGRHTTVPAYTILPVP
jgi:DNA-binding IclR family transcriptional regulator